MPTAQNSQPTHYSVLIVGGGQAGLSMSACLQEQNIDHLIFEKNTMMHSWKTQRWDSFTLVTPNWQCELPNHPYDGDDPKGFMKREEIIGYLDRFAAKVKPPILEGVSVEKVSKLDNGQFHVVTTKGEFTGDQVVIASGGYLKPIIPRMAERIPENILQIHSNQYKNSQQLPDGAVLVVGSGQSGAQIAEDLHIDGKKVFLATGNAPRVARLYRGKDVVEWLDDMGYYQKSVDEHPLREGVRDNTNHYVTGRDGGREIDLRKFALEGMELFGLMENYQDGQLIFKPNLAANLDAADDTYKNINARIDAYIEKNGIDVPVEPPYQPVWEPKEERENLDLAASGITSIIWCIGFTPDFSWLDLPVFNGMGAPVHRRGVTNEKGVYFIGLPWLYTWGSGRFSGVAADAAYLSNVICQAVDEIESTESLSEAS
ncbi:MAG: MSMEG_0569 family flavin-dependent oxidoreductase [Gammaproteobacteria bacterium]|nr:MSMEG_0569 family flavin-dependent oxidoreductase [Gammaproteobacteria bacterium]MBU1465366.1 MSMEG_0569 family flavin-dependent oxidoreductase [Gammaproteobacteria bacterium]MBU2021136.1 MSMEG_0569 family flavin-dependent oxidoreductase [Gammaproteobacteria bacterium]MBU2237457.1 MSMEG_0569 family flavin-dependent oxidoreductase [Gammaproteobacteria bacterium]MBU2321288.1 MSMEG_0569 family flavin-dependent oxidoreductase [Gammaproteobacteria bacterium]